MSSYLQVTTNKKDLSIGCCLLAHFFWTLYQNASRYGGCEVLLVFSTPHKPRGCQCLVGVALRIRFRRVYIGVPLCGETTTCPPTCCIICLSREVQGVLGPGRGKAKFNFKQAVSRCFEITQPVAISKIIHETL